eukprot:UN07719
MNGHDLIIENKNQYNTDNYKYTNKMGFAHFSALKQYRTFQDETIKALLTKLSSKVNIPLQHLSVCFVNCDYLYSGKNRLKEMILNWDEGKYMQMETDYEQIILDVIGNVDERTRKLFLLDKRKIPTIPDVDLDSQSGDMLIGIKYFDVFSRRLYIVARVYRI